MRRGFFFLAVSVITQLLPFLSVISFILLPLPFYLPLAHALPTLSRGFRNRSFRVCAPGDAGDFSASSGPTPAKGGGRSPTFPWETGGGDCRGDVLAGAGEPRPYGGKCRRWPSTTACLPALSR
uniref:Uncharacterized protein n=1 Tax=Vitrella brassicaformis TaxID=1169539 RepID=A0A7S1JM30_9ALVE